MSKKVVIFVACLMVVIFSGCGHAKEMTAETKAAFEYVLQQTEKENEGKSLGQMITQGNEYLLLYDTLEDIQDDLENGSAEDCADKFQEVFGMPLSKNVEENEAMVEDALDYILPEGRDYISAIARKIKECQTISSEIEEQKMDFTVEDTEKFLNEMSLSPESFGKVLAMLDTYAPEIEFTETGFSFKWADDGRTLKLEEDPEVFEQFVERFNEYMDLSAYDGEADEDETIILDDTRITYAEEPYYNIDFFESRANPADLTVFFNSDKTEITRVEYAVESKSEFDLYTLLRDYVRCEGIIYALNPDFEKTDTKITPLKF